MKSIVYLGLIILRIFSEVYAADVKIQSLTDERVTTGDIVRFQILDERDLGYFSRYKNKRIGPLLYMIGLYEKENQLYLEAIISEAGPQEKTSELSDKFIIQNLNYVPSNNQPIMDFVTIDIPISLKQHQGSLFIFSLISLSLFLLFFLTKFYKKWKRNRLLKTKKENEIKTLSDLFVNATTQQDFSLIYIKRKEIMNIFDIDKAAFEKTMALLNEIQYQKDWPQAEFDTVKNKMNDLAKNLRIKNGI